MAEELGNVVAGINQEGLHSLCLEIVDYKEKINTALQNITDSYQEATNYLTGGLKAELDSKYNNLKKSYPTIVSNIDSYIDEFNTLITKEVNFDLQVSQEVNNATASIEIVEGDGK